MIVIRVSKNNSLTEEGEIKFKNKITKLKNLKKCVFDNSDLILI